jgi:hypothetical protein
MRTRSRQKLASIKGGIFQYYGNYEYFKDLGLFLDKARKARGFVIHAT